MKQKCITLPLAAAFLAGSALSAAAVSTNLDFAKFIDGGGVYGAGVGEQAVEGFIGNPLSVNGVAVSATGWNDAFDDSSNYAYLDSGNAGIGVCKVLSGSQCSPGGDDNLSSGEGLRLEFAQDWKIEKIWFRNASHGTSFNASSEVNINGMDYALTSLLDFGMSPLIGKIFDFKYGSPDSQQMYISAIDVSPVPIPAGILLLVSGMAGFGYVFRKRNAA